MKMKDLRQLKSWLDSATKFYIVHYSDAVTKRGELSSIECLNQEKGLLMRKIISKNINWYLKKQPRRANLINLQAWREQIDYKYRVQEKMILALG